MDLDWRATFGDGEFCIGTEAFVNSRVQLKADTGVEVTRVWRDGEIVGQRFGQWSDAPESAAKPAIAGLMRVRDI